MMQLFCGSLFSLMNCNCQTSIDFAHPFMCCKEMHLDKIVFSISESTNVWAHMLKEFLLSL